MMKFLLAALLALLPLGAEAANCSSNPFTLTNGQSADATQVMSNFNNLLNCANNNLAHNAANSDITSLSGLTTPLSAAQGGSGTASPTANNVLLGNGASAFQVVPPLTAGSLLLSNGTTWAAANNIPLSGAINEVYTASAATPSANVLDVSGIGANYIDFSATAMGSINGFGTVQAGGARTLRFSGAAPGTLHNNGNLVLPAGLDITLGQFDEIIIRSIGSGSWHLVAYQRYGSAPIYGNASAAVTLTGSDTTKFLTAGGFAGNASIGSSGFYKLPGGLIVQWGSATVAGSSQSTVSWPTTFGGVNSVLATYGDIANSAGIPTVGVAVGSLTGTNFVLSNGSGSSHLIFWFAVGT